MRTPVFVDWWTFRVRGEGLDGPAVVAVISRAFEADLLGLGVEMARKPRGFRGFAFAGDLLIGGQVIGLVAWGGDHQAGWVRVELTGTGLGFVADVDSFSRFVVRELPSLEHQRVDLARDFFDRTVTPAVAEEAWSSGQFDPPRGPRSARRWEGSNEGGWTFYVGRRGVSRHFYRVYEKGMKWIKDRGREAVHPMGQGCGVLEDWVRVELELTDCAGALAADVIERRHEYFAGSCEYLASIAPEAQPSRMMVDPLDRSALSVMRGIDTIRKQYGAALVTLLHVFGDHRALLEVLTVGCDHSPRLVAGGALLVSREDIERIRLDGGVRLLSTE